MMLYKLIDMVKDEIIKKNKYKILLCCFTRT